MVIMKKIILIVLLLYSCSARKEVIHKHSIKFEIKTESHKFITSDTLKNYPKISTDEKN